MYNFYIILLADNSPSTTNRCEFCCIENATGEVVVYSSIPRPFKKSTPATIHRQRRHRRRVQPKLRHQSMAPRNWCPAQPTSRRRRRRRPKPTVVRNQSHASRRVTLTPSMALATSTRGPKRAISTTLAKWSLDRWPCRCERPR